MLPTIVLPLWAAHFVLVSGLTYSLPAQKPATASKQLSSAPVALSFEFFAYPDYVNTVDSTATCLQNLKDLSGIWPAIRIGGTTGDRARYEPSQTTPVSYTTASAGAAPSSLTYGPSFISLASEYGGSVILGLNRRLNDLANTVSAAKFAKAHMSNLYALELGNEPNFFTSSDPIAQGMAWTPRADYVSEIQWQDAVCSNLSTDSLISAGVFFGTTPMNIAGLIAQEKEDSASQYVKDYCSHNYPQSGTNANLARLMNHSSIASQIRPFAAEISAAEAQGIPHIFGETQSATQGGGGISPTYGAGLWTLDYIMQALIMGTKALYFHQGTIGNCQYCWWGRYSMGAPYYGAYFAIKALAGADYIAPLDDASTTYAAYAIYKGDAPVRVLFYNSDYYTSGTRPSQTFTLTNLSGSLVNASRLTAPYSTSRVDQGQDPSISGLRFQNGTCVVSGSEVLESKEVTAGSVSFTLYASEALLVYL